jgi:hypothetical protein
VIDGVTAWFEKLLHERDRRYEERFNSQKEAVSAAFKASQLAIDKAETALLDWKTSHNELQRQLKDQQATFYSRKDVDALLAGLTKNTEDKLARLDEDVRGLRETRSEGTGGSNAQRQARTQSDASVGLLIAGVGVAISALVSISALVIALVK